jgi:molybdopterin molybdotransferase
MVRVEEAEGIILGQKKDFGSESISFESAMGRVLAEAIMADRDLPAFNRVTMDGIAIDFEAFKNGQRIFSIKSIQAAGENPIEIDNPGQCIEIMTGAVLPGLNKHNYSL